MEKNQEPKNVYAIVTNRIIELLEQGSIPWKQPWSEAGIPQNLITKKPYRGINIMLLSSLNYPQNYFLTFKQAKELGAVIKPEEKPSIVVFWKWEEKENEKGEKKKSAILRYYSVFNVSQCENIPTHMIPAISRPNKPIQACKDILKNMPQKPEVKHKENAAFYHHIGDYINMPKLESFDKSENYYCTLFHELVHSTGHEKRLNRKELTDSKKMASDSYSIEELTAEIGACYLNSMVGIENQTLSNNVAYILGWLKQLRNDSRFVLYSATQAQKAIDFILNIPAFEEKEETQNEMEHEQQEKTVS